ncbi:MAG: nucleotidyl transferase AbiEii/AbiGii toxin family protein [Oligoflexales bacterium]|nr:nucleotidyl transferase AbiEii/AbiGii toxin family protein [Oligoflexales bacterium]
MTTKSKGSSVRQKLVDLSEKLGVQFQNLQTAFMIERLVARLVSDKSLSQRLVFKGGFVGLRVYESYRYTVDLDALLIKADIESTLKLVKEKAESNLDDGVWFRFEDQIDLATQGEYGGIRQIYRAGIGELLKNMTRAQIVHFDLGIGDPVTPSPVKMELPSLLMGNEDIAWSIYPVETIVAEKLHALISHGNINSRSKDIHDLAIFLPKADAVTLGKALKRSFEHRGTELPEKFSTAIRSIDTKTLERGWQSAVASISKAPKFSDAFEAVIRQIAALEKSFS